ncbi:3'-phosphoadenosine 5'-phosphosulfate sulfotransferase (PAPS reductase)/FAD synthetase or related enzyme, partial [Dysosmobacter welbionis]
RRLRLIETGLHDLDASILQPLPGFLPPGFVAPDLIGLLTLSEQRHTSALQGLPGSLQGDLHHLVEGVLPLLGGEGLPGEDVVGDGQQGQRPLPQPLGRPVEASRLHLQRQDAELPVHGPGVGVVVVELVRREHLTYICSDAHGLRRLHRVPEEPEVGGGAQLAGEPVLVGEVGVGRGPQGDDHIPDLHIIPDAAGGADADDGIHTEELVQLIAVNTHRGHAHTVAHDGDALALVGAGVAQHVPDGVKAHHLLQ